ncbi:MAG: hypothetical protein PHD82_05775 [Candidatus Riflebacteria bacterium]|jgi:hypothetical protein|nr:hypothetical protein [Candidatus Riflebacteria bacterium]
MNSGRQDELSLHMRIPADRCYLGNALLTLEGICDHFLVSEDSRSRIRSALEAALVGSIDLSYQKASGLFDLKFSVFKDKLQITVEDFMLNEEPDSPDPLPVLPSLEQMRQRLDPVAVLTDGFKVFREAGRNSCYSMQFNLVLVE